MRKKRSGAAEVSAVPSSPPPIETPTPPTQAPLCLWCQANPAVKVLKHRCPLGKVIFCSESCATMFALDAVAESHFTWCLTHNVWSNRRGKCQFCELQKQGYQITTFKAYDDAHADEKAVTHE